MFVFCILGPLPRSSSSISVVGVYVCFVWLLLGTSHLPLLNLCCVWECVFVDVMVLM